MRSWVRDGQVEEDICYKQMNISLIHNRENLIAYFFLHQVLARLEEEEDINEVHKLCKIFWKVADMRLYFVQKQLKNSLVILDTEFFISEGDIT